MVGVTGFEPATTCTPSKCPTRLGHTPIKEHPKYIAGAEMSKESPCSPSIIEQYGNRLCFCETDLPFFPSVLAGPGLRRRKLKRDAGDITPVSLCQLTAFISIVAAITFLSYAEKTISLVFAYSFSGRGLEIFAILETRFFKTLLRVYCTAGKQKRCRAYRG